MAERRMFAKTIIDSDSFLDMSLSAQALYFHLSMRADDEGFVNNQRKIMRMIGTNIDDIKLLATKGFIIPFESGVIVIKHWKLHNYIRSDRIKKTVYTEEMGELIETDNGSYSKIKLLECQTDVSQLADECQSDVSIGKVRLGEDRIDKVSTEEVKKKQPAELDSTMDIVKNVIADLNERTGCNYKHKTKNTIKLIKARLIEGYELDDFKEVNRKMTIKWLKDPKMAQYLRPNTLYNSEKFESYLNLTESMLVPLFKESNKDDIKSQETSKEVVLKKVNNIFGD